MIKQARALSLAEVQELLSKLKDDREKIKKLEAFIKKFNKISAAKAQELRKELEALNIFGLRQEEIVKIIDLLPEDAEDLRKITSPEISLKQDEIQKILEIVQKYRA
ncbi:MAG: hypothetical protein QXQ82_00875 [Candidatus Pacearchaeota archaeon]